MEYSVESLVRRYKDGYEFSAAVSTKLDERRRTAFIETTADWLTVLKLNLQRSCKLGVFLTSGLYDIVLTNF